jgi:hypothetical protein
MAGRGKSARGIVRGKALPTPREMRKRKDGANAHMEDNTEGTPDHQEPGPSQEGRKKRKTRPTELVSSDYESDESDSDWKGTSKWQHNIPQSIETPDFVNLSVPPSFKKIMCGGGGLR